jgi:hypothetical protein
VLGFKPFISEILLIIGTIFYDKNVTIIILIRFDGKNKIDFRTPIKPTIANAKSPP